MVEEVKNSRIFPLVFSECFVVHKQIDRLAVTIETVDPFGEFIGEERVFFPASIGETKSDIVAERIVFQQQLYQLE